MPENMGIFKFMDEICEVVACIQRDIGKERRAEIDLCLA